MHLRYTKKLAFYYAIFFTSPYRFYTFISNPRNNISMTRILAYRSLRNYIFAN